MNLLDQFVERDRKARADANRQWARFRALVAAAETPPDFSADLIGALIALIKGARDDA